MIMGLGTALFEELDFDDGQVANVNRIGIAERQSRQLSLGGDFENGHVDLAIGGDNLRRQPL